MISFFYSLLQNFALSDLQKVGNESKFLVNSTGKRIFAL